MGFWKFSITYYTSYTDYMPHSSVMYTIQKVEPQLNFPEIRKTRQFTINMKLSDDPLKKGQNLS
jgi:hypothetical protein